MPATFSWCQGPVLSLRGSQAPAHRLLRLCRHWLNLGGRPDNGTYPKGRSVARTVRCYTVGAFPGAETGRCKGLVSNCRLLLLLCGDVERNPGPLRFVQQNVNGVSPVKLSSLLALDADLYLLQEVKKSPEAAHIWKVPGYTVYCSPRDARGGGVATLVRQRSGIQSRRVPWTALPNDTSLEAVVVELVTGTTCLRVANVYIPPPAIVTESLSTLIHLLDSTCSILAGDFNLLHPLWWSEATQSDQADAFVDLAACAGFELHNCLDTVTRRQGATQSALDLTLSRAAGILDWTTLPSVDSDHRRILFTLDRVCGTLIPPSRPLFSRLFYAWKRADWAHFSRLVERSLPLEGTGSLSKCYLAFRDTLGQALKASCPRGCRTAGVTLWTPEMAAIERKAHSARVAYEAHPSVETLAALDRLKSERHRVFSSALQAVWSKRLKQANPGDHLPWKMLRRTYKASTAPLEAVIMSSPSGVTKTSARQKCRHFASTFLGATPRQSRAMTFRRPRYKLRRFKRCDRRRSESSTPARKSMYLRTRGWMTTPRVVCGGIDDPFNMEEYKAAVDRLSSGKACGGDGMYNEMLHHLPPRAEEYLLTLINWSWATHRLPQAWRSARIIPLLKNGRPAEEANSYRPVSLTSCVSKLMERMVLARLLHVWRPSPDQYAYRRGLTTEYELAHITDTVEIFRNVYEPVWLPKKRTPEYMQLHHRPHRTLVVLVDFSKAFDTVQHHTLIKMFSKLEGGLLRRWLRNFLRHRSAEVIIGKYSSGIHKVRQGVPQGTVLGPQLFSMYTQPLLESLSVEFPDVQFDMYADDLTITISAPMRVEAVTIGNAVLRSVQRWSKDHGMALNPRKCEAMLYTLSSHTDDDKDASVKLALNGCEIPVSTIGDSRAPKLLGMQLDVRASFNEFSAVTYRQCHTRIAQLSCMAHHAFGPKPKAMRQFVHGYGFSKLLHGTSVAWGCMQDIGKDRLIAQYVRMNRIITGLPPTVDEESALLESNCPPLHIMALRRRFWLYEACHAMELEWAKRPPPEPPPRSVFRVSPISRIETWRFVDDLLTQGNVNPSWRREPPLRELPYPPWACYLGENVSVAPYLPLPPADLDNDAANEFKRTVSNTALDRYASFPWVLATDGSADLVDQVSAAAAVLLPHCNSVSPLHVMTYDCGPLACSYRTESLALLQGLDVIVAPLITSVPEPSRSLLVVTDSQSLLAALNTGPLRQRGCVEAAIWDRLMRLSFKGWTIHLQFVYAHVDVIPNEVANTFALRAAKERSYTQEGTASLWLPDLRSYATRRLMERWRSQLRHDTHRFSLCGSRPADLSGLDLETGKELPREDLVNLSRIRCGEHPKFGRLFWKVRGCANHCRWCNATAAQRAALTPQSQCGPNLAGASSRAPSSARASRVPEKCPHCPRVLSTYTTLVNHCRTFHPTLPPPKANDVLCHYCGTVWPSRKSRGMHISRCEQNPDRHVGGNNSHALRRSLLPKIQPASLTPQVCGAEETLRHMLGCRTLAACRATLCIPTVGPQDHVSWRFLHSQRLLQFVDLALATPVPGV